MPQPPVSPLSPSTRFDGQTVLVTGANTGLGYATALILAQRGASTLIFGVRDLSKGEEAKRRILADASLTAAPPSINVLKLDLLSEASVDAFTKAVQATTEVLHTAVLNAGIWPFEWETTEKGQERSVQVNFLSTALLAKALLPLLLQTASTSGKQGHLTVVGSILGAQKSTRIPLGEHDSLLAALNDKRLFKHMDRYGQTKLLVAAYVHRLAASVDASKVVISNVDPGYSRTGLARDAPWYFAPVTPLFNAYMGARKPEVSAQLIVRQAACGVEAHGCLIDNDKKFRVPLLEDKDFMRRFTADAEAHGL